MIIGIGTDIISIERIAKTIHRYQKQFLHKVFTQEEIAYCEKRKNCIPHFAGRFAGKEAVAKALGCGIGTLSWKDIEILVEKKGKPTVLLTKKARDYFDKPTLHLTISHEQEYAIAYAIAEKNQSFWKRFFPNDRKK